MSVAILSFDPGILNMGVCALNKEGHLIDWNVWKNIKKVHEIIAHLEIWMSLIIDTLNENNETSFIVVIERQPVRNRRTNRINIILETYFNTAWKQNCKHIRFINSNTKWLSLLQRPVPKTYTERKKESVRETRNILNTSEKEWIPFFDSFKKQDDLADAYLQGLVIFRSDH